MDKPCREYIKLLLKSTGPIRGDAKTIAGKLREKFMLQFDEETVAHELHALKCLGDVLSCPVRTGSTAKMEKLWLLEEMNVPEQTVNQRTITHLIERCRERRDTFPESHREYEAIGFQIDELTTLKNRGVIYV